MSDALQVDPKVIELLTEIARDPRSCLLRIPRADAPRALFERDTLVRPSATLLTRAERELLRAHRCEVAALLRQAYIAKLYAESPVTSGRVRRIHTDQVLTPIEPSEWIDASMQRLADAPRTSELELARELVARCHQSRDWRDVDVQQLIAVAQRLEPRDHGRIYAAMAELDCSRPSQSRRILEDLLSRSTRRSDRAFAWLNLGNVCDFEGDFRGALGASEQSREADPELVTSHLNVVIFSTLCGDASRAMESAAWVVRNISADDPDLARIQTSQRESARISGGRVVSASVRSAARDLESRFGASVRSIIHEYT